MKCQAVTSETLPTRLTAGWLWRRRGLCVGLLSAALALGSVSGGGAKNAGTDFYEDFRDKKTEDMKVYLQTNAPTKEALALHRTLGPASSGYYFVTRMGGSELPPCPNL